MKTSKDNTSSKEDENKRQPDGHPKPLQEKTKKETDILEYGYEGKEEGGNVAAKKEEETRKLDGSNANTLRTK